MSNQTYELVIAVLSAEALFKFITYIIERHDTRHNSPERLMLRALGGDKLAYLLRKWKHADERSADDWEVIDQLYTGYRKLGGNGSIEKLYEECSQIQTTD